MANLVKDYRNLFDVKVYLETYFTDPQIQPWALEKLLAFWKKFDRKSEGFTLLEFGGGPNISRLVSACQYVENIVFTEHTDGIRAAVQNWVDKKGFDWKATFDFVVQELEGKGSSDARDREEELRRKIKAIVPCDAKADEIVDLSALDSKLCPPYDVVFTSYCLEAVVESDEEYKNTVYKLANLVKPGGYLVMHGALEQSFYKVGKYDFYSYKLSQKLIQKSLENAGITQIVFDKRPIMEKIDSFDMEGEFFVFGQRR